MRIPSMALILGMGISGAVSAEIYQCHQANGQVVFSDSACADDARVITVDPVTTGGRLDTGTDVKTWQPKASHSHRHPSTGCDRGYIQSTQLRTLRVRRQVEVGMSSKQVRYVLGDPDHHDGQWWVYERKGKETGRYRMRRGCLVSYR